MYQGATPYVPANELPLDLASNLARRRYPLTYAVRNHELFGVLAGVRGDSFKRIDATPGTPANASPYYAFLVMSNGADGHSHNFVTLDKLLAYDWTESVRITLQLSRRGAVRHIRTGVFDADQVETRAFRPRYLDISSFHQLAGAIDAIHAMPPKTSPLLTIEVPCSYLMGDFHSAFLPRLKKLDKDPANVRLCYFFDN
jgi:hypothetical protein